MARQDKTYGPSVKLSGRLSDSRTPCSTFGPLVRLSDLLSDFRTPCPTLGPLVPTHGPPVRLTRLVEADFHPVEQLQSALPEGALLLRLLGACAVAGADVGGQHVHPPLRLPHQLLQVRAPTVRR